MLQMAGISPQNGLGLKAPRVFAAINNSRAVMRSMPSAEGDTATSRKGEQSNARDGAEVLTHGSSPSPWSPHTNNTVALA